MTITNNVFLNNIEIRRTELGMKIGDLEKAVEVSPGYFSRFAKNPESLPSVDLVLKLSIILNVSIDVLLRVDLRGMTEGERLVNNFVNKLRDDTVSGRIEWCKEGLILNLQKIEIQDSIKEYGHKAFTNGSVFKAKFGSDKHISIKPLALKIEGQEYPFFDIDIEDDINKSKVPICSSCRVQPITQAAVSELVGCILRAQENLKIPMEAKNLMYNYLDETMD